MTDVGVSGDDLSCLVWRKASASTTPGGNCVEVAAIASRFAVRDSKDIEGPTLVFNSGAWTTFMAGIKLGAFD